MPKFIEEKSESTYNKYFKTFKESWGAEFKNYNSAEELYNDIINMNKDLPEDFCFFINVLNKSLILWWLSKLI